MRAALFALGIGACGGPQPPEPAGMVHIKTPGRTGTAGNFWMDRFEFPNRSGEPPRVYTHALEARDACAAAGKRLCTAAEWRRACEGPEGSLRFGYGPTYEAGRCHASKSLKSGHTSMMKPEELVAPSGAFDGCATPEGVHDLVGNVEEWVNDDWRGVDAMLEGGAWYTYANYADCSGDYSRHPDYRLRPDKEVYSAGFRCCWTEAEPTDADIREDRDARLHRPGPLPQYDAEAENSLAPGVFIDTYEYPNRPGVAPLVAVDQQTAAQLCEAADKRLCTAGEWELACGGPDGLAYPYGNTLVRSACPIELAAAPATGAYLGCQSGFGAYDLVGSVWEWTATPLDAPVLQSRPDEDLRELRGGSWKVDPRKGACRATDGYPAAPADAAFPDVGFRCCRGPELDRGKSANRGTLDCPDGMVSVAGELDSYCIDMREYPNEPSSWPQSDLTLEAAIAACDTSGKHLCSEAEWLRACSGPELRRWPYGNTYDPEACHDNAQGVNGGGHAVQSGYRAGCTTPEGILDLSGNVWEWTLRTAAGADGHPREHGVLHGGGWNLSAGMNQCRSTAEARADHAGQSGARCCANATEAAALRGSAAAAAPPP